MTLARGTNIMIKLSEIGVVVLAAGIFLLGCLLQPPSSKPPGADMSADDKLLENIPQAELDAVQLSPLPNDSGIFIAYSFKEKVTDRQAALLLTTAISVFRMTDDTSTDTDKVIIVGCTTPARSLAITADFTSNEVELWQTPDNTHYLKEVYRGDPQMILLYIKDGVKGQPVSKEKGKIADEVFKKRGGHKVDV